MLGVSLMRAESGARRCSSSGPSLESGLFGDETFPRASLEEALRAAGCQAVAGVDEAGRGPLAGPVVAAAVILAFPCRVEGIRDSKLLSPGQRERLFAAIHAGAVAVSIGAADVETIDRINILQASRLAMRQAVAGLGTPPDYLLVDAVTVPGVSCPQRAIVHGDRLCLSIAAASVIAKVTRDRVLVDLDRRYPEYGFAAHKGYATRDHLARLERYGACPEHRRSFAPVRQVLEQVRLFG
ncbi:MAG: ribonuclease HII [Armatimonadetes bacterium]|nr:ribonuclease HII [Armatimonadota bacterium]